MMRIGNLAAICCLLALVAGLFYRLNVTPAAVDVGTGNICNWGGEPISITAYCQRGWPFTYRATYETYNDTTPAKRTIRELNFSRGPLVANVAVAFIAASLIAFWLWRRSKRGQLWHLSLRQLFGIIALISLLLGWFALQRTITRRETEVAAKLNPKLVALQNKKYCGPGWLCRLVPAQWHAVFDHHKRLSFLTPITSAETNAALQFLPQLPNISSIEFSTSDPLRIYEVSTFRNIEGLDCSNCVLDRESIRLISQLTQLRSLRLGTCTLEPEELSDLAKLSRLETLDLDLCTIKANDLDSWRGRFPQMQHLHIARLPMNDKIVDVLSKFKGLIWLDLRSCSLSEQQYARLAQLPGLQFFFANIPWRLPSDPSPSFSPLKDENLLYEYLATRP